MAYDFKAWLQTKPNDEKYDYMNCQGKCAVGQYMSEVLHEPWDIKRYSELIHSEFTGEEHYALQKSDTFGTLKAKILEDA